MTKELKLAFIGGGNMASALASGLIGKRCGASDVHVIDPYAPTLEGWARRGVSTAPAAGPELGRHDVWIFAVKPQAMREAVNACRPFLRPGTLVVSIAAGVRADTMAEWLGGDHPHTRLVRCMPNTPALIGEGVSGLMALSGVSTEDKTLAEQLLRAVGEVVWVDSDAMIDAVTALSGSGPAYVFLLLEAMIAAAVSQGLAADQARTLALGTLRGATQLAALSPETPAQLRERVTSKGGTTAAALQVFRQEGFESIVARAMAAARDRAAAMAAEFH
ncbi:MAG TPA: pyrroline-5-carboxylate reductase [Burkholderiaceae bacterium]|nr:pyrroline-5-carboxylate reductase [Burkholderiaceae bacterium]